MRKASRTRHAGRRTIQSARMAARQRPATRARRRREWASDDRITTRELVSDLPKPVTFNGVGLRENVRLGQSIEGFALDHWESGAWKQFAVGTSIGSCRLVRLPERVATSRVRLRITK